MDLTSNLLVRPDFAADNELNKGLLQELRNLRKIQRRDIILDLLERGEARGVVDHSDITEILSNPLISAYLPIGSLRATRFIRYLSKRGIEVLDQDIDKTKYKILPMVIVVGSPVWDSFYSNIVGETLHFPNRYRDMVLSGRPFVYFRVASARNKEQTRMEYIGCGIIGDIIPHPDNKKVESLRRPLKWCAQVCDYHAFDNPVFWKDGDNPLEILEDHEWTDLVRDISTDTYNRIIELEHTPVSLTKAPTSRVVNSNQILELVAFNKLMADYGIGEEVEEEETDPKKKILMANIHEVVPSAVDSSSLMMTIRARPGTTSKELKTRSDPAPVSYRRSKHSVVIGIRAEEIVVRLLQAEAESMGYQLVRWVATEGEKPGWDIEIIDAQGDLHAIEVKGTSGKMFPSVDLTAAEWHAAEKRREKFWLFLVTECLGKHPKIQRVNDPVSLVESGVLLISPLLWKLELSSRSES